MTYWVQNAVGETLVGHQCRGMGTKYVFCDEFADEFTLEQAQKLSVIHGGEVVVSHFN